MTQEEQIASLMSDVNAQAVRIAMDQGAIAKAVETILALRAELKEVAGALEEVQIPSQRTTGVMCDCDRSSAVGKCEWWYSKPGKRPGVGIGACLGRVFGACCACLCGEEGTE